MGSVTIHLLVEKSLGAAGVSSTADNEFNFESTSHILPADSSLAELMNLVPVKGKMTVLDLSYNPVKNISSIVRSYTDVSGPMSKTLQSMNWYPSGKLCILPLPSTCLTDAEIEEGDEAMLQRYLKWQSRNVVQDEDFAYNNPTIQNQHVNPSNNNKEGVQWTGIGAADNNHSIKPSQIFSAVSNRADNDITNQDEQLKPKKLRTTKRSEKQRTQRLDTLIQNLARTSKEGKKKRVSDKVRTMLIKSRADGNKKLRMEDRFHLELLRLIDDDEDNITPASNTATSDDSAATSYNFFSRVTAAGKVASSISGPIGKNMSVEFLVSVNKNYRRLPNTMSLHDAQQAGWLKEFDTVVIRIFSLEREDCQSKSVLDPESDVDSENEVETMQTESTSETPAADSSSIEKGDVCKPDINEQTNNFQQRLHMVFNTSNEEKSTKKKKPVSKQVQRMLMKSKSVGNKGVKPDDRVHLDTIIFYDNSKDLPEACSSSFRFFSKRTSIEQLASTFRDNEAQNVEILVPQPCDTSSRGCVYQQLSPLDLTLEQAVKKGLLEDFGRVIVRLTTSNDDAYGNVAAP